jgi:hypothetical protein
MMDKKIFSIDRLEGELAVCISDDDDVVVVERALLGDLCVRDIFRARLEGETLFDIEPDQEERDRRLVYNKARLHALARKPKK